MADFLCEEKNEFIASLEKKYNGLSAEHELLKNEIQSVKKRNETIMQENKQLKSKLTAATTSNNNNKNNNNNANLRAFEPMMKYIFEEQKNNNYYDAFIASGLNQLEGLKKEDRMNRVFKIKETLKLLHPRTPIHLDALAGAFKDMGGNPSIEQLDLEVTEISDEKAPTIENAEIFYDIGLVKVTGSETIDATPSSLTFYTQIKQLPHATFSMLFAYRDTGIAPITIEKTATSRRRLLTHAIP